MEYCAYNVWQFCETPGTGQEYGSHGVEHVLSTIHENFYAQLYKLDGDAMKKIEIATMGAKLLACLITLAK